jgi:glycosyltransferase involved in cell wall biosynthesis
MKIAYDSQIFCIQTYGGVSRYFCEIASRIAKEPDVQVSIAAPMHFNAYLAHMPAGIVSGFRVPNMDRFRTDSGKNYPHMALRGLNLLMGDLMLRAMRPDIIHETYFISYRPGSRRARRVITIHDMIHEKFPTNFPYSDKTARYKALAAKRADHIICVSESTRRDAIEILGLPPDKVSVIYHGFDLMKATASNVEEQALSTNGPFLLYVGHRGGYKNFLRLLEAYSASATLKTEYKLVCFGGGAFLQDELNAMQALGMSTGQVIQLGGDDQLLAKLYSGASAYILPSLYEGFGIPPLEAMSYGCPVVCSNTSSIPEVVGDAGEYFNPADTESMRAAIEHVVSSESHRTLLIARGHERLKNFSWDRCASQTLDIYRKLA